MIPGIKHRGKQILFCGDERSSTVLPRVVRKSLLVKQVFKWKLKRLKKENLVYYVRLRGKDVGFFFFFLSRRENDSMVLFKG